eukprot:4759883-Amphidinium_carterae.1
MNRIRPGPTCTVDVCIFPFFRVYCLLQKCPVELGKTHKGIELKGIFPKTIKLGAGRGRNVC